MKKAKSAAGIILALMLVFMSVASAFAATEEQKQEVLTHSYNAYQVFSAEGVDDTYLSNTVWGAGFDGDGFLNALKASADFADSGKNVFAGCTTAEQVARVLDKYENDSETVKAFAVTALDFKGEPFGGKTYKNGDAIGEAGLYLFEDASSSDIKNPVILKMAADSTVHIEVKASVPMVEKKVLENSFDHNCQTDTLNASVPFSYGEGYNDAADYGIGDVVPFELIGTIPENIGDYQNYYYAFIDTLSEGLTFRDADRQSFKVTLYDVQNGAYVKSSDITGAFTVSLDTAKNELSFVCDNLVSAVQNITADSIIVVNYTAVLNDKAVVGLNGNLNEVYLEYSNSPHQTDSHGKTKPDTVVVFTYGLNFKKTDIDGSPVEGAQFCLMNGSGMYYSSKSETGSCWVSSEADAEKFVSGDNGMISVRGIDEGDYQIKEVKAPEGFKLLKDSVKFVITAVTLCDISDDAAQNWTGNASEALTSLTAQITDNPDNAASNLSVSDVSDAVVSMDIINVRTFELPGTGGAGTVFFYIGGGILVAAAVALLAFKRKVR